MASVIPGIFLGNAYVRNGANNGPTVVDLLIVSGGGGGGYGGGGGGGVWYMQNVPVTEGVRYNITVGAGGTGNFSPTTGGPSMFEGSGLIPATDYRQWLNFAIPTNIYPLVGGGAGGFPRISPASPTPNAGVGRNGASSGGGAISATPASPTGAYAPAPTGGFFTGLPPGSPAASGTIPIPIGSPQRGNYGGNGAPNAYMGAGGGGGAGGAGVNGRSPAGPFPAGPYPSPLWGGGAGGAGKAVSITGAPVLYGGGGGGGGTTGGAAGPGGGGKGGPTPQGTGTTGTPGTPGLGGGGGGIGPITSSGGYLGGDGIIYIAYPASYANATANPGGTLSFVAPPAGPPGGPATSTKLYAFTGSGLIVW